MGFWGKKSINVKILGTWTVPAETMDLSQTFCLFLLMSFLGAIFARKVCLMIILLGCAFPGPMQTSGTYNLKRPRLYNLNHCLTSDFCLLSEDSFVKAQTSLISRGSLQGCMLGGKLKTSLNNVYNLWISILVLCDKSPCPPPQTRQSMENVFVPVSEVYPCLSSITASCYIAVHSSRKRDGTREWFKKSSCFRKHTTHALMVEVLTFYIWVTVIKKWIRHVFVFLLDLIFFF